MVAFIILLVSCAILMGGYLMQKSGPDPTDEENKR